MWEDAYPEFNGKVVKNIFKWVNHGTMNLTDNAVMIVFEDNSQLLISVPKNNESTIKEV
jgi:hypothetical protein